MKYSFYCYVLVPIFLILLPSCVKEEVPFITTSSISDITGTTAISGGIITNEGSSTVIARGVCWSTSSSPSLADNKTTDGAGVGSYTSNLSGLNGGTNYFVRAYATNSAGTGYGMAVSFTTFGKSPTPEVAAATNINTTSATLNGSVNANYLSTVVTFEYGTTTSYGQTVTAVQSPLTSNEVTNVSADISGLTAGTLYHYRIKGVNSLGTTNSNDIMFTTLGTAPSVRTSRAVNIGTAQASLLGYVNANYLSTVVTIDYGLTTSYGQSVTATESPMIGNTLSGVSADVTGLNSGTDYHFRVVGVNSLGTTTGDDMTFRTLGAAPIATTMSASNVTNVSSQLNGVVNANHLSTIVTFEYGTTAGYGQTLAVTQSPVIGSTNVSVSTILSGLTPTSTYHFRIVAVNSLGTNYGNDMILTTLSTVSDVDGNSYNIVPIGTQVWMTENLKTTKYSNGDLIGTTIPASLDLSGETTPKYQWAYNGNESNATTYGRLYSWFAITDGRNVCPTGWHVPTDAEWTTLANYLANNGYGYEGSGTDIAKSMAATSGWAAFGTAGTIGNNQESNNRSSFTALPSGYRFRDGTFFSIGELGYWWSSTESSSSDAYHRALYNYSSFFNKGSSSMIDYGFSVRCIRDF